MSDYGYQQQQQQPGVDSYGSDQGGYGGNQGGRGGNQGGLGGGDFGGQGGGDFGGNQGGYGGDQGGFGGQTQDQGFSSDQFNAQSGGKSGFGSSDDSYNSNTDDSLAQDQSDEKKDRRREDEAGLGGLAAAGFAGVSASVDYISISSISSDLPTLSFYNYCCLPADYPSINSSV